MDYRQYLIERRRRERVEMTLAGLTYGALIFGAAAVVWMAWLYFKVV